MARLPSLREALGVAAAGGIASSPRGRRLAVGAGRLAGRGAVALARRHPYIATASILAELGYIYQDEIEQVARDLARQAPSPVSGQGGVPTFGRKTKRKLSKANKAMAKAMKATKNNFKQATKIASKANPNTKSKIGKGATKVKKLARKIRRSVWGSIKRLKK